MNTSQIDNPNFVDELVEWIRFNEKEALETRDGLAGACIGSPSVPRWLGKLVVKYFALNSKSKTPRSLSKLTALHGLQC